MNIILILLIIHFLGIIIFKPKNNILSCGIFAWAGKSSKSFNKAKFDIQGLYNNSRGGDSCGVSTDGEIYYGIHGSKHYSDFLSRQSYNVPAVFPVVIGHTRKSSSGTINAHNAHPFGFGDNKECFEFIGVHNGTLHNSDKLANEFEIEKSINEKSEQGNYSVKRDKIDSEILLEILYKTNDFKVLSKYIGGAALIFSNTLEPNVVYVFKGASRFDSFDKDLELEERPLFYYRESKNSLYISSLQESLEAIGGVANENLYKFKSNVLYKITDGNIDASIRYKISREKAHQRPEVVKTNYTSNYNLNRRAYDNDDYDVYDCCGYKPAISQYPIQKENKYDKIQDESKHKHFKSTIIFNKLRYQRNGHLVNGVCTWVKEYGFVFICKNENEAKERIKKYITMPFDDEYGYFMDYYSGYEMEDLSYPFSEESGIKPKLYYFFDGVMLQTELDYIALISGVLKNKTVWELSEMSVHPIISMDSNLNLKGHNEHIISKRNWFTGTVCPLGSGKIYYIEKGELINSTKLESREKIENQLLLPFKKDKKEEIDIQQEFNKLIEKVNSTDDNGEIIEIINNDEEEKDDYQELLLEVIQELMMPVYTDIQEAVISLDEYKEEDVAKKLMKASEEFLTEIEEIMEKNN